MNGCGENLGSRPPADPPLHRTRRYDPLMTRERLTLLALAAAALLPGCAGASRHHVDERPSGQALPEPDPGCRREVQRTLATTGLEQVIVRVAVGDDGRPLRLDLLGPDLSPASQAEVRRAFAECSWTASEGGVRAATFTFRR